MFNPRSGAGLALTALVLVAAAGVFAALQQGSGWSEDDLGEGVRRAAAEMERKPRVDSEFGDYGPSVAEAVRESGAGPSHSVRVTAPDGDDRYQVSAAGVRTRYCLRIEQRPSRESVPLPPGADGESDSLTLYDLTATVRRGPC